MDYLSIAQYKTQELLEKAMQELQAVAEERDYLVSKAGNLGLTTDELQGIHGLIQGQIKLIKELQFRVKDDTDVYDLEKPINSLVSLASLVSKPTD